MVYTIKNILKLKFKNVQSLTNNLCLRRSLELNSWTSGGT